MERPQQEVAVGVVSGPWSLTEALCVTWVVEGIEARAPCRRTRSEAAVVGVDVRLVSPLLRQAQHRPHEHEYHDAEEQDQSETKDHFRFFHLRMPASIHGVTLHAGHMT